MTQVHSPFSWLGKPVEAVLLDMDGTMIDTKEAHGDAWESWTGRRGVDVSRERYMSEFFGLSNKDAMKRIYPELAEDPVALRAFAMERESEFVEMVRARDLPPVAGLFEFLQRLERRGIPVAVASSAPRENVEAILEHLGLAGRLPVRLSMDDVERTKPEPDLFLLAAERLHVSPSHCVVFEDSLHGLKAGHRAGCRTVAVLTLHDAEELDSEADLCVEDFEQLLQLDDWKGL